jgi:hypothetical protein
MYKKLFLLSVVVGLILFAGGTAALSWALIGQRNERQQLNRQREERERFNAGLNELERVVSGEIDVRSFVDTVPEDEYEPQRFDERKATAEIRESVTVVAIVCMFVGGAISVPWLLLCTVRLLARGLSYLRRFLPVASLGLDRWRQMHSQRRMVQKRLKEAGQRSRNLAKNRSSSESVPVFL